MTVEAESVGVPLSHPQVDKTVEEFYVHPGVKPFADVTNEILRREDGSAFFSKGPDNKNDRITNLSYPLYAYTHEGWVLCV